jgi:CRISPR-associated protein Csm1
MAVAGLLHDLGKWHQRAGLELAEETLRQKPELCPSRGGGYSHQHVLWTYQAIKAAFAERLCPRLVPAEKLDALARLAAKHHAPQYFDPAAAVVCPTEEFILQQADHCSAMVDRRPDEEHAADRYNTTLLQPLFLSLRLPGTSANPADLRWRLEVRSAEGTADPVSADVAGQGQLQKNAYRDLWDKFVVALNDAPQTATPAQEVDLLDGLLARHTWAIPSAADARAGAAPDVPLYDHARSTAALAETLYRHYREHQMEADEKAVTGEPQRPRLLLVGGDVSGIQAYIFRDREAKGQARRLRARSFLIAALTRATASWFLKALDLPHVCLLSEAGGRFQFLAPYSAQTLTLLRRQREMLHECLLKDYLGEIAVHVAETPLSLADFKGRFAEKLDDLALKLETAKAKPVGAESLLKKDHSFVLNFPAAENFGPTPSSDELNRLGRDLVRCSTWILSENAESPLPGHSIPLMGGALRACLVEDPRLLRELQPHWLRVENYVGDFGGLPVRPTANHVPHWTEQALQKLPGAVRAELEAEQEQPLRAGVVKTFHALAQSAVNQETGRGRPLLAVLKADVDRLGELFSRGLGEWQSPARYAGLSRLLDDFFGARLPVLLQKEFPDTYTVFSGGDDLLLIGPWERMLPLALRLREAFAAFVGHNPCVTLSAALVLVSPRLPLRRAADAVEEDLEAAKAAGRNRIAVLRRIFSWDAYAELLKDADVLMKQFSGEQAMPSAFLRRLFAFAKAAERLERMRDEGGEIPLPDLLWNAHYRYQLGRNIIPWLSKIHGETQWKKTPEGRFWEEAGRLNRSGCSRMAALAVPVELALHRLRQTGKEKETVK